MSGEVVTVQIHGLVELERALLQLPEEVAGKALQTAVNAGGRVIRDEVMVRAPVGTVEHWIGRKSKNKRAQPGNLRKLIRSRRMRESRYSATVAITWSGNAFYGKFKEFGTYKMKAEPFLRPAADAKGQAAVDVIKDRLARRINAAAKKLGLETARVSR